MPCNLQSDVNGKSDDLLTQGAERGSPYLPEKAP
jgi:hypothetical protein